MLSTKLSNRKVEIIILENLTERFRFDLE